MKSRMSFKTLEKTALGERVLELQSGRPHPDVICGLSTYRSQAVPL